MTASMLLFITALFYPCRLFLFLSQFKASKVLQAHLNSIVRTSPGVCVYMTLALIIAVSFTMCSILILGSYLSSFNNILSAFFHTTSTDLFQDPEFQ
jgi:hypothetical protein